MNLKKLWKKMNTPIWYADREKSQSDEHPKGVEQPEGECQCEYAGKSLARLTNSVVNLGLGRCPKCGKKLRSAFKK